MVLAGMSKNYLAIMRLDATMWLVFLVNVIIGGESLARRSGLNL